MKWANVSVSPASIVIVGRGAYRDSDGAICRMQRTVRGAKTLLSANSRRNLPPTAKPFWRRRQRPVGEWKKGKKIFAALGGF